MAAAEAALVKEGALEKKNEHKKFGMAYSTRYWTLSSQELQYYTKKGGELRVRARITRVIMCMRGDLDVTGHDSCGFHQVSRCDA